MATVNITINDSTWTQVLDGAGFCISPAMTLYSFNAITPTTDLFSVKGGEQVNGAVGQILWAKSSTLGDSTVTSTPLA